MCLECLVQQRILSTFIVRTLATAPQQSITVELSNRLWRMVETQSRQITRNINCADKPYASTNTLSQPQDHLNAASTAQTQITVGAAEGCDFLILIHQTRGTRPNHRRLRNTSATKSTSSNHREANTNTAVRSSPTQTNQTPGNRTSPRLRPSSGRQLGKDHLKICVQPG